MSKLLWASIWFPMELNAYYNILTALGVGGYRDQGLAEAVAIDYGDRHFTCFHRQHTPLSAGASTAGGQIESLMSMPGLNFGNDPPVKHRNLA